MEAAFVRAHIERPAQTTVLNLSTPAAVSLRFLECAGTPT